MKYKKSPESKPLISHAKPSEINLDVEAAKHRPRNNLWTPEEKEIVRRYYRRVPFNVLMTKLGRTAGSVQSEADALRRQGVVFECDKIQRKR